MKILELPIPDQFIFSYHAKGVILSVAHGLKKWDTSGCPLNQTEPRL